MATQAAMATNICNNYSILFCERAVNTAAQDECRRTFPLDECLPPDVVRQLGAPACEALLVRCGTFASLLEIPRVRAQAPHEPAWSAA